MHPKKSRVIYLSHGIDFVGFRNFYYFRLVRKRNIRNMELKLTFFAKSEISYEKVMDNFNGWNAYAILLKEFMLFARFPNL